MTLEIPSAIIHFTDGIRTQSDILTALSGAGIILTLLTWFRVQGLSSDMDLRKFRRPALLIIPLVLFLAAHLLGYLLTAALTGYFAEVVMAASSSTGQEIVSAASHFVADYSITLATLSMWQIVMTLLGLLTTTVWFLYNLLRITRA